nr:hypothetical protein [Tanacetum cinerariifolium]
MKKRRTGKADEPSKKFSKSKESAKGKTLSNTSKTGKSVSADKSVHEPEYVGANGCGRAKPQYQVGSVFNLLKGNKERKCSSSITKSPAARYILEGIEYMIPTLCSPFTMAYDKDAALGTSHWGQQHAALRTSHWGQQRQQYYRAMINRVSKHEVFSTMRILSVVSVQVEKKSGYGYLKEIVVRRADQKLYKFKEGDFPNLHLNDIEDMLLLIAQNKLFNLEVKEPYTLNFDPPWVIYEDKSKKKSLMRVDEIHKFCGGTLQSVCNIFRQRILNFKFGYNKGMPSREWTTKDKRRTGIMLNKIDDQLFKRWVLRSLEVLVSGRKTETNKRMLQRTV